MSKQGFKRGNKMPKTPLYQTVVEKDAIIQRDEKRQTKTPQNILDSYSTYHKNNRQQRLEYQRAYRKDPINQEKIVAYRNDPVNKARKSVLNRRNRLENPERTKRNNRGKNGYLSWIKTKYGVTEELFIELYEKQGRCCFGCEIKLVSSVFNEERKQYDDDPNMIENVDYAIAYIDHDHSFDIDGNPSGNPDSVRGLLCPSCNAKDVLNPVSQYYILGDDPTAKETLIKNREANMILRQWHIEENSEE